MRGEGGESEGRLGGRRKVKRIEGDAGERRRKEGRDFEKNVVTVNGCLTKYQASSFPAVIAMSFSSHQLCEVLTTTESGLPEAQTNHRN